jgi:hypothetical protein
MNRELLIGTVEQSLKDPNAPADPDSRFVGRWLPIQPSPLSTPSFTSQFRAGPLPRSLG